MLTVISQNQRAALREANAKKKYQPLDLRAKKTRALRRSLSVSQVRFVALLLSCQVHLASPDLSSSVPLLRMMWLGKCHPGGVRAALVCLVVRDCPDASYSLATRDEKVKGR